MESFFPKMILFSILVVHITSKPLVPSISSSYAFVFFKEKGEGFRKNIFFGGRGRGSARGWLLICYKGVNRVEII
jgi:hypothetical protein